MKMEEIKRNIKEVTAVGILKEKLDLYEKKIKDIIQKIDLALTHMETKQ
jgi:hypothetical protein